MLSTLSAIGFQVGFLLMVFAFLPSLSRVLAAPPDLPIATNPRPAPRPIRDGIVFDNVSFSYPGRDEPVLDGLSLRLRLGEAALVGPNGSGKTTLVKLILRMYDPTGGRILLDGHDLRDYDLDDLRRELGVLFQDFLHYEFSAADNERFAELTRGRMTALVSHRFSTVRMADRIVVLRSGGYWRTAATRS